MPQPLAIIDSNPFSHGAYLMRLEEHLATRGFSVRRAEELEAFEQEHGSLASCAGLLFHPGFEHQKEALAKVRGRYPELRLAFLTYCSADYAGTDVPVFRCDFMNIERVSVYFFPPAAPPK